MRSFLHGVRDKKRNFWPSTSVNVLSVLVLTASHLRHVIITFSADPFCQTQRKTHCFNREHRYGIGHPMFFSPEPFVAYGAWLGIPQELKGNKTQVVVKPMFWCTKQATHLATHNERCVRMVVCNVHIVAYIKTGEFQASIEQIF